MVRIMAGLAAWAAGTAIAVSIAWLGANVVVRNAGVGPGMPVISAPILSAIPSVTVTPPVPVPPSVSATPTASAAPTRTPAGHTAASGTAAPSAGTHPSPSASTSAGDVRTYALTGGSVTLNVAPGSVQLVTAVPDVGYSVQTWSGTDWLRVDFSSGAQVSSLIASWYEQTPSITVTN
jgi:hypothetical protein